MACLSRGYVFKSRLGLDDVFGEWMPEIAMELAHESYAIFAKERGERRAISREDLGNFLAAMKAEKIQPRNVPLGESMQDVDNFSGGSNRRAVVVRSKNGRTAYAVGKLSVARAAFTQHCGFNVKWHDDSSTAAEKPHGLGAVWANGTDAPFTDRAF
jgi:hypothetical protein